MYGVWPVGAEVRTLHNPRHSSAQLCKLNGWMVGDLLCGDEGYGATVIQLTAIGDDYIMARSISHNGSPSGCGYEGGWTLHEREWSLIGRRR